MIDNQHRALIVIPCLNEELHLNKLVRDVMKTAGIDNFDLVIADGGSTDQSPQIAKELEESFSNVRYLFNPKKIQSAGVNLAVKEFGGHAEFLIRIDAHAQYPTHFCKVLIDEADEMRADAVVVALDTTGKSPFQKGAAAAQNSFLGTGGSAHRVHREKGAWIDHGHHALMRLHAFNTVNGYDESFSCNEDAELDHRLLLNGYKIWLTAKTSVVYYARSRPAALFRQYFGYGFGRAETILKHKLHPRVRQLIPAAIVPIVAMAFLSPLVHGVSIPFFCWLAVCFAYGGWLAYKANDVEVAYAGPAAVIMHLGWSLGFWRAVYAELKGTRW